MGGSSPRPVAIVAPVYTNGTTVLQELALKGAHIVAVDSNPHAIGFASRYVREKVVLPPPRQAPRAFADWLLSRADLYGAVVVPTDDFHVRQCAEDYDRLSTLYKLAVAPRDATLTALVKARSYEVMRRLGHPMPRTVLLDAGGDPRAAIEYVGFPAIVKPSFGISFQTQFKTKAFIVENDRDFESAYEKARGAGHAVMLQEIIPGPDTCLATCRGYADGAGNVRQVFTAVKLASFPPKFGIGQAHESRPVPDIVAPTLDFVREIGYRGALFAVEWKYDARDRKYKFIEMNARSVMSTGIMKYCGFDVIDMMWRDKMGLEPAPLKRIRWGRRYVNLKDGFLLYAGYPEARRSLREYLRICRPPVKFYLTSLRDPRPLWADLKPLIARRLGRGADA